MVLGRIWSKRLFFWASVASLTKKHEKLGGGGGSAIEGGTPCRLGLS